MATEESIFDNWDEHFNAAVGSSLPAAEDEPGPSVAELSVKERQLRMQIEDLDKRLVDIDGHYVVQDSAGNRRVNYDQLERDRSLRMSLRDKLDEVRRQEQQAEGVIRRWTDRLKQVSVNFARGNMSRVPEAQRAAVMKRYKDILAQFLQSGGMANPLQHSEQALSNTVQIAFSQAIGFAQLEGGKPEPASESGNPVNPEPKPEVTQEDKDMELIMSDEFARRLYERAQAGKPMSLAAREAAERRAAEEADRR